MVHMGKWEVLRAKWLNLSWWRTQLDKADLPCRSTSLSLPIVVSKWQLKFISLGSYGVLVPIGLVSFNLDAPSCPSSYCCSLLSYIILSLINK